MVDDATTAVVPRARPRRPDPRVAGSWLDNWLPATTELAQLRSSHPMVDAVIDEIDGRLIARWR